MVRTKATPSVTEQWPTRSYLCRLFQLFWRIISTVARIYSSVTFWEAEQGQYTVPPGQGVKICPPPLVERVPFKILPLKIT